MIVSTFRSGSLLLKTEGGGYADATRLGIDVDLTVSGPTVRARVTQAGDGLLGGRVTDFIDLQWWPVFNIADAGITVGGIALVLLGLAGDAADARARRVAPTPGASGAAEPER